MSAAAATAVATVRVPVRTAASELRAIKIVWHRELIRYFSDRLRIVTALLQPALFLFVLGTGLSRLASAGTEGLSLPIPTWDPDIANWPFYYTLVGILGLQLLLTWWIRRIKLGTGLVAIREDETKAATIGINLPVEKTAVFARSSSASASARRLSSS